MDFLSDHSAEVIALCALIFTAWQAIIQRKHNKISVKPLLLTHTDRDKYNQAARLQITLTNSGLGPAFVNEFSVLVNGKTCDFEKAVEETLGPQAKNSTHTVLREGYAMPHNENVVLLAVKFRADNWEEVDAFEAKLDVFDLIIKYSSAYGEKFTLDTREKQLTNAGKGRS